MPSAASILTEYMSAYVPRHRHRHNFDDHTPDHTLSICIAAASTYRHQKKIKTYTSVIATSMTTSLITRLAQKPTSTHLSKHRHQLS